MFKLTFSDNINVRKATMKLRRDKHMKELEKLSKSEIYVGFPESAKNEDGLTIAKDARWNNYGTFTHDEFGNTTSRIPERPFFTKGFYFEKYQELRTKLAKFLTKQITAGKISAMEACGKMGAMAVNNVRDAILTGPWASNKPATVARKLAKSKGKKSKYGVRPLVDTGDMIGAVTYIVKDAK